MAPGVTIVSANLIYENSPLFKDLNFSIVPGQCTCILGPSGVGKTSLLRLIAGLHTSASVKEIFATDKLPLKGRVAYMGQQDSLLPWLTIVDNLLIGTRLRGHSPTLADKKTALQLLRRVGLENVSQALPKQLSGGMRQRAILTRTLYEAKPLILMDEPFAALDVITRSSIQTMAAELLAERTVVLVTHDPLEALRLGHHVYIMSGKPAQISAEIVLEGKPPRELTDPLLLQTHGRILAELSEAKAQVNEW